MNRFATVESPRNLSGVLSSISTNVVSGRCGSTQRSSGDRCMSGLVLWWNMISFASRGSPISPPGDLASLPADQKQLSFLVDLDRQATGSDRERLLTRLVNETGVAGRVVYSNDSIAGYLLLRPGSNATQIGPGMAITEEGGRSLGGLGTRALRRTTCLHRHSARQPSGNRVGC